MQNPLENWILKKTSGIDIKEYQIGKLTEILAYVSQNSTFYQKLYHNYDIKTIKTFADFEKLPFVTADDLVENGLQILCVPQTEIERIVTLNTSGTAGNPKRIYFTEFDQELTVDFFHNGMRCLVDENDRFMILLPYKTPGSVGDLLGRGLARVGCGIYPYGLIEDYKAAGEFILKNKITSLVGNPVQVLKLAELTKSYGFDINMKNILLSTDYVPSAIAERLSRLWNCDVYEHYGMTEMCFGGGVYCENLSGYHLREADLYFEIISEDGEVLPAGEYGEVVFTTLTRTGMPLVRYRTGDYGRFKKERCACSERLALMEKIKRRIGGGIRTSGGKTFYINDFDEIIFSHDGVTDYDLERRGDEILVKILEANDSAEETRKALSARIREETGFSAEITVEKDMGTPLERLVKRQIL